MKGLLTYQLKYYTDVLAVARITNLKDKYIRNPVRLQGRSSVTLGLPDPRNAWISNTFKQPFTNWEREWFCKRVSYLHEFFLPLSAVLRSGKPALLIHLLVQQNCLLAKTSWHFEDLGGQHVHRLHTLIHLASKLCDTRGSLRNVGKQLSHFQQTVIETRTWLNLYIRECVAWQFPLLGEVIPENWPFKRRQSHGGVKANE